MNKEMNDVANCYIKILSEEFYLRYLSTLRTFVWIKTFIKIIEKSSNITWQYLLCCMKLSISYSFIIKVLSIQAWIFYPTTMSSGLFFYRHILNGRRATLIKLWRTNIISSPKIMKMLMNVRSKTSMIRFLIPRLSNLSFRYIPLW